MNGPAAIQRADPAARRRAVWWTALIGGVCLVALAAIELHWPAVTAWLERHAVLFVQRPWLPFLGGLVLIAPVVLLAGYLFRVGSRTVRAQRFPPPGYAVARDTPVLEGRRAAVRGRIVQSLAAAILLAASAIPVFLWLAFFLLGRR